MIGVAKRCLHISTRKTFKTSRTNWHSIQFIAADPRRRKQRLCFKTRILCVKFSNDKKQLFVKILSCIVFSQNIFIPIRSNKTLVSNKISRNLVSNMIFSIQQSDSGKCRLLFAGILILAVEYASARRQNENDEVSYKIEASHCGCHELQSIEDFRLDYFYYSYTVMSIFCRHVLLPAVWPDWEIFKVLGYKF